MVGVRACVCVCARECWSGSMGKQGEMRLNVGVLGGGAGSGLVAVTSSAGRRRTARPTWALSCRASRLAPRASLPRRRRSRLDEVANMHSGATDESRLRLLLEGKIQSHFTRLREEAPNL